MNAELREAIRKVREAAAQSRNVKLDSPLWKAIADLCAVADKELPSLAEAADELASAARYVLDEGEYDDLGSFIIRNVHNDETIAAIDDLSQATFTYEQRKANTCES